MAGLETLLEPTKLSSTSTAVKKGDKRLKSGGSPKRSKPSVPTGPVKAQKPFEQKRRAMLGQLVRRGVGRKG